MDCASDSTADEIIDFPHFSEFGKGNIEAFRLRRAGANAAFDSRCAPTGKPWACFWAIAGGRIAR